MAGRPPALSDADKERLRRMIEDGLTIDRCATYLLCGPATVYRALREMRQVMPIRRKNPRAARAHLFREQNARID